MLFAVARDGCHDNIQEKESKMGIAISSKAAVAGLAVAAAVGVGGLLAQPAEAATTISVNVRVTTGQCPQGGSVRMVNASITDPGLAGSVGRSSGDTVAGLKTLAGYRSLIQGSNFCQTTWYGGGYYWYWSAYRYLYNNNQTTFI